VKAIQRQVVVRKRERERAASSTLLVNPHVPKESQHTSAAIYKVCMQEMVSCSTQSGSGKWMMFNAPLRTTHTPDIHITSDSQRFCCMSESPPERCTATSSQFKTPSSLARNIHSMPQDQPDPLAHFENLIWLTQLCRVCNMNIYEPLSLGKHVRMNI